MSFEYVWGFSQTSKIPPTDKRFHSLQHEYKYYPISFKGSIVTFDLAAWDLSSHQIVSPMTGAQTVYWPTSEAIVNFLQEKKTAGSWCLVALSNSPSAKTIDPNKPVTLSKIPPALQNEFLTNFSAIGYDVIDKSGLSALTNVGYSKANLQKLAAITIQPNKYGLLSTPDDGHTFAEFSSYSATEHAPFFPIEVWAAKHSISQIKE